MSMTDFHAVMNIIWIFCKILYGFDDLMHTRSSVISFCRNCEVTFYMEYCMRTCVTKQCNLVPTKGLISLAGKITAGLVESNGSVPPSL